ncbi:hypothetical protein V474_23140 [Novosphingobium barchaimii LL02]|uniref:Uncharacterized protein n=1 Tax=Novosphingobium barchaimii LL02 TaxID=1114963 RepID=A0A0J7XNW2_9SPHN|nr:hypothetical protein [Novosphingobium barchaimii]KMS53636.1 hypothetical protein V474_23140 [Novosphingobium barchaimii LL02]
MAQQRFVIAMPSGLIRFYPDILICFQMKATCPGLAASDQEAVACRFAD